MGCALVFILLDKCKERRCIRRKVLRCNDMGAQCSWVGRAETEEGLLKIAPEDAARAHCMGEIQG